MTPDSLEAAVSETPCLVCQRGWLAHPVHDPACGVWQPDPPALAAAARRRMRDQFPSASAMDASRPETVWSGQGYNAALTDVAKALGLEEA